MGKKHELKMRKRWATLGQIVDARDQYATRLEAGHGQMDADLADMLRSSQFELPREAFRPPTDQATFVAPCMLGSQGPSCGDEETCSSGMQSKVQSKGHFTDQSKGQSSESSVK